MMERIKIKLDKTDCIKEILAIISQSEIPRNIIFSCSTNLSLLADIKVLKKIKNAAKENDKYVEFVNSQKFTRDILNSLDFNVYSKCPSDYKDLEERFISDLYKKKELPSKNKKIFQKKNEEKDEIVDEKIEKTFKKHQIQNPGRKKTSRSKIFFILIAILFLLGEILLWITPKAIITIKPQISSIPVIQNIIIELPESEIEKFDEDLPRTSGVFISSKLSGIENFASSGRRYDIENSRGKVTIFNETDKPKFLLPSRLSTEDGMIYRFNKEITIPAKKGNNPGEKVVEIVADRLDEKGNPIGYRGNILAGTELFFPALREPLRELYYAKANRGPLVGGSTLTHYLVTEEDKEKSAKYLQEVLQSRAIENLKKENNNRSTREKKQYVLLENKDLLVSNFSDFKFPDDLIGQESETFEVGGSLDLLGIVFDQDVVKEILLKKLHAVLDDRQQLIDLDESSIEYTLFDHKNFEEKKYVKVSVKAVGIKRIDFGVNTKDSLEWIMELKKQIAGKNENQVRSILINVSEIEQVMDIKISPFWNKNIPKILDRIELISHKVI